MKTFISGILGGRILSTYNLEGQVCATCGPWSIYKASNKKPGAIVKDVSVWVLDKKRMMEANKQVARSKDWAPLFEQQRSGCQHVNRIKHPGVIKVVEPLEDNSSQMLFATEPVLGSLQNLLTRFKDVPGASTQAKATPMSMLEMKLGMVQLTETLAFLHNDASLIHCGISPQSVVVTPDGSWKLAGFNHAVASHTGAAPVQYSYDDPFPPVFEELAKPMLPYTAPELISGLSGSSSDVSPGADVFSTSTLLYELITAIDPDGTSTHKLRPSAMKSSMSTSGASHPGEQLLPVRSNVNDYRDRVLTLQHALDKWHPLSVMPEDLQGLMHSMLAMDPSKRPQIESLATSPFFHGDVLLRALRFIDTLLQRDVDQKVVFVKHLSTFWQQFDERMLNQRVLPALIKELHHEQLQATLLPVLLAMMERVNPAFFFQHLLPLLAPMLETAQGELLAGLVVGGSNVFMKLMTRDVAMRHLMPLYKRALESHDAPHVQLECLKVLQANCGVLDLRHLREGVIPRTCGVCLATTKGSVRAQCFLFMACAVPRLGPKDVDALLDTSAKVVEVDRSPSTVVCVSQLLDTVSAHLGADATATRVLPVLCPLLVAPTLSGKQFKDVMAVIQTCLTRVSTKFAPDSHLSTSASTHFSNTAAAASAAAANAAAAEKPTPVAPAAGPKGVAAWDTQVELPKGHAAAKAKAAAAGHGALPPSLASAAGAAAAPAVSAVASVPSPSSPPSFLQRSPLPSTTNTTHTLWPGNPSPSLPSAARPAQQSPPQPQPQRQPSKPAATGQQPSSGGAAQQLEDPFSTLLSPGPGLQSTPPRAAGGGGQAGARNSAGKGLGAEDDWGPLGWDMGGAGPQGAGGMTGSSSAHAGAGATFDPFAGMAASQPPAPQPHKPARAPSKPLPPLQPPPSSKGFDLLS